MQFLKWFGILSFIGYCFLANYFYLERATMLDNSFQLFSIIRYDDFAIQVNRFLAVFTQIFPLIGSKFNLSLETLARLHTLSFPIVYGFCFFLIAFVFSNKRLAIVFLGYHFLIVSHSFFWPQCELIQGVSWFLVYASYIEWLLNKNKINKFTILIGVVFLVSLIFMHPLLILLGTFYFLNEVIAEPQKKKIYIIQFIAILVFTLLKKLYFENGYDNNFNDKVIYFFANFSQEIKMFKLEVIYDKFVSKYVFLNLGLILILCYLAYIKSWVQFFLLLSYSIGLLTLIYIAYGMNAELFYAEVQYNLIVVFITLVIVRFLISFNWTNFERLFYPFMFFLFCFRVINVSDTYTSRLSYIESLTKNYHGRKVILRENEKDLAFLKMTWGSSFETWLFSTIKTGESSSIILTGKPERYSSDMHKNNAWITEWETIDYEKLNPKYFVFKDTGTYVLK